MGRAPYLEYRHLGCPSPLLYVPWALRLLGCALNVIFAFLFCLTPADIISKDDIENFPQPSIRGMQPTYKRSTSPVGSCSNSGQ